MSDASNQLTATGDADVELEDSQLEDLGTVRIAPRVLRTVIEEAARGVRGVARLARSAGNITQLVGRAIPIHGVGLHVQGQDVSVDLYLIVEQSANMVEVGTAVQEAVSVAIEEILGMHTKVVNVFVQDIA
ncbi:MAG TPA: Asp23/Gls24 family envelope stress response protein [Ktedonobacterales bacterium]